MNSWICGYCESQNDATVDRCAACDAPRNATENHNISDPWIKAVRKHPDLEVLDAHLRAISAELSRVYRSRLLEFGDFRRRRELAKDMEHRFLRNKFGANPTITEFAKTLLLRGKRNAAKFLNAAITSNDPNISDINFIEETVQEIKTLVASMPDSALETLKKELAEARAECDQKGVEVHKISSLQKTTVEELHSSQLEVKRLQESLRKAKAERDRQSFEKAEIVAKANDCYKERDRLKLELVEALKQNR